MNNDELVPLEVFLDKKRDFSPFLVHLTRSDGNKSAKEVLSSILNDRALKAKKPWFIYYKNVLKPENANMQSYFYVVCFTETPLDQIEVLLQPLKGRWTQHQPEPYGLVFEKSFIKEHGGNHVFYMTKEIAEPLSDLYDKQKTQVNSKECRLLALTSLCEKKNDWHWEREWRIVGNLGFDYNDIFCGLCPESDIAYFENKYEGVKFISPDWGINKILDNLLSKIRELSQPPPEPEDAPF